MLDARNSMRLASRGTVVVADDDAAMLMILTQMLTKANYRVVGVRNGMLACDAARREHPDVILLDWSMPVMSGLVVLGILKDDASTKTIPVIMLTAHRLMEKHGIEAGIADFLVKPCDAGDLIASIERQRRTAAVDEEGFRNAALLDA